MANILLLDCTLRDGGYINHWHFGREIIPQICAKLAAAKIDIIEMGFLINQPHTEDDSLYANCEELDAAAKQCGLTASRVAAMIAIGETELEPEALSPAAQSRLDIVRITFHNSDAEQEKAFRFARQLMDKGYEVCMQPVGTTSYTDKELLDLIAQINTLDPYAFYLVDTLGILQRKELQHFIDLIDHNLASGIKFGFHSHNNLQMSYANAQYISDYQTAREFILDCSVYGMGRGAGNLCTELIARYLNDAELGQYELMPIYEILDNHIYPIFTQFGWGYNTHYYISAVHQCHPNYAAFLMNKQTLTMNEVDLILRNLPAKERHVFHRERIDELYYCFQNHNIDDSEVRAKLGEAVRNRNILLLAPGKSISSNHDVIEKFIAEKDPVVISINTIFQKLPSHYVFISNLKRLYSLDTEHMDVPVILTSNLPNVVRGGMYLDYAALCDKSNDELDNSGVMLLRLMAYVEAKRVYIAGFDGFSKESINNYFDGRMINSVDPGDVDRKNASIARQLNAVGQSLEIISLTPSMYFGARHETV